MPAADWDTDDWISLKRIIIKRQDFLVNRGTIPFLCKLISESEDPQIKEEAVLVCITLLLGGNLLSQNSFYDYMVNEDPHNKLLIAVKQMLSKSFDMTKKNLVEKNAQLEMVAKIEKNNSKKKKKGQNPAESAADHSKENKSKEQKGNGGTSQIFS